jgi:hypothetical protein
MYETNLHCKLLKKRGNCPSCRYLLITVIRANLLFFLSALLCFVFLFVFILFLFFCFINMGFFAKKNIFLGLASRRRCFQTLRHIKLLHYMFFYLQQFLYTFAIEFTPSFEWGTCCSIFNFL